jgi:beta-glucosidase
VLLKTKTNTLPLKKDLKNHCRHRPNADAPEVLLGNYNGQPLQSVTPLAASRRKSARQRMCSYALGSTLTGSAGATVPASATPGGFKASISTTRNCRASPCSSAQDEQVNFDWSRGRPAPEVNEDGFSVRWTGKFRAAEAGQYQLGANGG